MHSVDYADHFTLDTDLIASPEQWARAIFGNAPNRAEILIWRVILGLRLARGRSPDTVAGWRIGGRGDTWLRMEAVSRLLTATILIRTTEGQVSAATLINYEGLAGRLVWTTLSGIHRALVPGVLRGGAARLAAGRSDGQRSSAGIASAS